MVFSRTPPLGWLWFVPSAGERRKSFHHLWNHPVYGWEICHLICRATISRCQAYIPRMFCVSFVNPYPAKCIECNVPECSACRELERALSALQPRRCSVVAPTTMQPIGGRWVSCFFHWLLGRWDLVAGRLGMSCVMSRYYSQSFTQWHTAGVVKEGGVEYIRCFLRGLILHSV